MTDHFANKKLTSYQDVPKFIATNLHHLVARSDLQLQVAGDDKQVWITYAPDIISDHYYQLIVVTIILPDDVTASTLQDSINAVGLVNGVEIMDVNIRHIDWRYYQFEGRVKLSFDHYPSLRALWFENTLLIDSP